jgi:hypothetical protein
VAHAGYELRLVRACLLKLAVLVLDPPEYATGKLIYPYEEAKK